MSVFAASACITSAESVSSPRRVHQPASSAAPLVDTPRAVALHWPGGNGAGGAVRADVAVTAQPLSAIEPADSAMRRSEGVFSVMVVSFAGVSLSALV